MSSGIHESMRLHAFFKYFGAKHRIASRYGEPLKDHVVEPFAGSAAYALRYHEGRRVTLLDKDPKIRELWKYLRRATSDDIERLPLLPGDATLDDVKGLCDEERTLIGFWFRTGSPTPRNVRSSWAKREEYSDRFWGEKIRSRIASQVGWIRGWQVLDGSYEDAPDIDATWFIDPPYQKAGGAYTFGSKGFDYQALARWVGTRKGQVIVCEAEGADWLPFAHLVDARSNVNVKGEGTRFSREFVYHNGGLP